MILMSIECAASNYCSPSLTFLLKYVYIALKYAYIPMHNAIHPVNTTLHKKSNAINYFIKQHKSDHKTDISKL